jgi:hypothetical protein
MADQEQGSLYDAEHHIRYLKLDYLQRILKVDNPQAVQASVAYASVLNEIGVTAENYPLFLEVLNTNNKWVIDGLTEGMDLDQFFKPVIPTYYIVQQIFSLFTKKRRNELNEKTMRILLAYLLMIYREPHRGYEMYPLSIPDVNNMAKHIREDRGEDDHINHHSLEILRYLNEMNELSGYKELGEKVDIATQAGKIRSCFYDTKRTLRNALTEVLLEEGTPQPGIQPEYIYAG